MTQKFHFQVYTQECEKNTFTQKVVNEQSKKICNNQKVEINYQLTNKMWYIHIIIWQFKKD